MWERNGFKHLDILKGNNCYINCAELVLSYRVCICNYSFIGVKGVFVNLFRISGNNLDFIMNMCSSFSR